MRAQSRGFLRNECGASAVEFALVAPLFFALIFATINFSIGLYGQVMMHYAAEDAARCFSVRTTICTNTTTTQTYASGRYVGPNFPVSFTASQDGACHYNSSTKSNDGHKVLATATYNLNAVVTQVSFPLTATACFP